MSGQNVGNRTAPFLGRRKVPATVIFVLTLFRRLSGSFEIRILHIRGLRRAKGYLWKPYLEVIWKTFLLLLLRLLLLLLLIIIFIGTTAHCGLWPVEQCPSIFSYLPPTLSIFSLPALEDIFLLPFFQFFLGLPLLLVPSSFWVKIFLGILSSSILSRWPNQLILCPFIHFTIFSPLVISSSSRSVRLFHSPLSYLGPYILLNIFLSKIIIACSSFFVNVHASAPYNTTGLISVLYNIILVALDKSRLLKRLNLIIYWACTYCTFWLVPVWNYPQKCESHRQLIVFVERGDRKANKHEINIHRHACLKRDSD